MVFNELSLSSAEGLHDEHLAPVRHRVGQVFPVLNDEAVDKDRHVLAQRPGILQHVTAQGGTLLEIGLQNFRHGLAADRGAFGGDVALQIGSYMDRNHNAILGSKIELDKIAAWVELVKPFLRDYLQIARRLLLARKTL